MTFIALLRNNNYKSVENFYIEQFISVLIEAMKTYT